MEYLCSLQLYLLHDWSKWGLNAKVLVQAFVNRTGASSNEIKPIACHLEHCA